MEILSFLAPLAALAAPAKIDEKPTFAPRWWYSKRRLDARPVIWALANRPADFRWQTEGLTLVHTPSKHVFWTGSHNVGLYDAECSCSTETNGRFQRFQVRGFRRAVRAWRLAQNPHYDPAHFAAHFTG